VICSVGDGDEMVIGSFTLTESISEQEIIHANPAIIPRIRAVLISFYFNNVPYLVILPR
jgi:hypothetical protein